MSPNPIAVDAATVVSLEVASERNAVRPVRAVDSLETLAAEALEASTLGTPAAFGAAMGRLLAEVRPIMASVAKRNVRGSIQVDDLIQVGLETVFRRFAPVDDGTRSVAGRFDPSRGSFRKWAAAVVVRPMSDHAQTHGADVVVSEGERRGRTKASGSRVAVVRDRVVGPKGEDESDVFCFRSDAQAELEDTAPRSPESLLSDVEQVDRMRRAARSLERDQRFVVCAFYGIPANGPGWVEASTIQEIAHRMNRSIKQVRTLCAKGRARLEEICADEG